MELQVTDRIRTLLQDAADQPSLPQDVRAAAQQCREATHIAWTSLKTIADAYNAATSGARPRVLLHELCSGSQIILPPARSERQPNPQLEARREELRRKLEDMQYADMVKDITKTEREAESMKEMLPTYQAQMTFGVHVLLMMFTGFATCYWGSKVFLGWDELWAGLLGVLGLAGGLILETTLLIVRSNMPPSLEQQYPHLFDPKKYGSNRQRKQQTDATAAVTVGPQQQAGGSLQLRGVAGASQATSETKKRR